MRSTIASFLGDFLPRGWFSLLSKNYWQGNLTGSEPDIANFDSIKLLASWYGVQVVSLRYLGKTATHLLKVKDATFLRENLK